jgi:hypothetical protein
VLSLSTNALFHLTVIRVVAIYRTKWSGRHYEQITTRVSVIPSFDKSIPHHKHGGYTHATLPLTDLMYEQHRHPVTSVSILYKDLYTFTVVFVNHIPRPVTCLSHSYKISVTHAQLT